MSKEEYNHLSLKDEGNKTSFELWFKGVILPEFAVGESTVISIERIKLMMKLAYDKGYMDRKLRELAERYKGGKE